jgi:hypothetical protein
MRAHIGMVMAIAMALGACDNATESAGNGTLKVMAATSGALPDADGYVVTLADRPGAELGANAEWSAGELAPGSYTLQLTGIAANCTVEGDNPRSIVVETGRLAAITFAVACTASLRILTETTGVDPDATGFVVTIGGAAPARVPASGSTVVPSGADGTLPVQVTDVAANCVPDPANPTTVSVAQPLTDVTLRFSCTRALGAVRVSLTTNAWGWECDTLVVSVDELRQPIIAGTPTIFEGLEPGAHMVVLSGLSEECSVRGDATVPVTLAGLQTMQVNFKVDGIF